jgi:hypothetical protein
MNDQSQQSVPLQPQPEMLSTRLALTVRLPAQRLLPARRQLAALRERQQQVLLVVELPGLPPLEQGQVPLAVELPGLPPLKQGPVWPARVQQAHPQQQALQPALQQALLARQPQREQPRLEYSLRQRQWVPTLA